MLRTLTLGFTAAALASGCAQPQAPNDQAAIIKALGTRVQEISDQLQEVTQQLNKQRQDIDSNTSTTAVLRTEVESYGQATLDPAQRGFARVDANVGTFAVSLNDVQPFADGVRVHLDLGNLSSATFGSTTTLNLKYGKRMPQESQGWPVWKASLREKKETVTEKLLPGHWNPVQVVLPGIEAKDFGYLEVSISTDMVYMAK
jgi:hypothetical protein